MRHVSTMLCLGLLSVAALSVPGAFAQTADCLDYAPRDHWLPNPHGTSSIPIKLAEWSNHLVVLRPEGLELIGLDNPQVPAAAGRIVGTFSDFALGPDFIVLGSAGRLQGFDLPHLTPRFNYLDTSTASPRLACSDSLVVAAFGRRLELFTNAVPANLVPVSAYDLPQYNTVIGVGSLQISGDYLLGCAGGGNNVAGYYGALTVVDIADPALPVMTDRVTFAPGDPDSSSTLFFEAQPYGTGFVVSGLLGDGYLRPEYSDNNSQFLARIKIEGGRITWHGLAMQSGPMTCGFVIAGDTALWTVGLGDYGAEGSGSNSLVNLDWNLGSPVLGGADHHFRPGRMCWVTGRSTLISGSYLYHLESLRAAPWSREYAGAAAEDRGISLLDDRLAIKWRYMIVQVGPHDWSDVFFADTYDYSSSPATRVDGWNTWNTYLDGCAVMGRHVYLDLYPINACRLDIAADGTLSEPDITDNETMLCAIPWGDHFVVATDDSLEVVSVDAAGQVTTISAVARPSVRGVELTRVDDLLLVKDHPYNSPYSPATVYVYDLSDIIRPRLSYSSTGWQSYLEYDPESGLLFDFGSGGLRWQRLDASGRPSYVGRWATPFPGAIWDLRLHGDTLYLAMGSAGLGVFKFEPTLGLTPIGGDLGVHPARLVSLENGKLLLSPDMVTMALECSDPLPVFTSGFHATRDPNGVRLTWRCETTDSPTDDFEVRREGGGPDVVVGRHPVTPGEHDLMDNATGVEDAHSYSLYLTDVVGRRTLLDTVEVSAGPAPSRDLRPTVAPNPFNASTTISFDLPSEGRVRLSVYDLAGRLIRTLVDDNMPQGSHRAVWDGRDLAGRTVGSGSYMARVEFEGSVWNLRMGLLK